MSNLQFTNNAATTLASSITNVATSLTVAGGAGALFPVLTGSQYFYCTLQGLSGTPIEIVKVTARSTDTFTITRAQDGTTASAFSTGDRVELRLVAAELNAIPWKDQDNVFSGLIDNSPYTGAFYPPSGTTAQRPVSPTTGAIRWNSTTNTFEVYTGGVTPWTTLATQTNSYIATYLVVAGGGGTGAYGGGGAGGLLTSTYTIIPATVYTIVVGAGGAAGTPGVNDGSNGVNSYISGIATAVGGGNSSGAGGSGGGGAGGGSYGAGTSGQGNNGGLGIDGNNCGGGGGAGAVGGSSPGGSVGGAGGAGTASSITGTSVVYAGGGGGQGGTTGGAAGSGGGGSGAAGSSGGSNGTVNLGGGGGGYAHSGGSGVVIISVPTANYSGTTTGSPTVTTSGSNTIMKFTASGTYTA